MKRCPECKRDYYDETLVYCLDDGSVLFNGPNSAKGIPTAAARTRWAALARAYNIKAFCFTSSDDRKQLNEVAHFAVE